MREREKEGVAQACELTLARRPWHFRCPENFEFAGTLPPVLAASVTEHWFDPWRAAHARTRAANIALNSANGSVAAVGFYALEA